MANCVSGPFMNSASSFEANGILDRLNDFIDSNGIVWIPMFAVRSLRKYPYTYASMHSKKDADFKTDLITNVL